MEQERGPQGPPEEVPPGKPGDAEVLDGPGVGSGTGKGEEPPPPPEG